MVVVKVETEEAALKKDLIVQAVVVVTVETEEAALKEDMIVQAVDVAVAGPKEEEEEKMTAATS